MMQKYLRFSPRFGSCSGFWSTTSALRCEQRCLQWRRYITLVRVVPYCSLSGCKRSNRDLQSHIANSHCLRQIVVMSSMVRWDFQVPWHHMTPIRRLRIWQAIGPNAVTDKKKLTFFVSDNIGRMRGKTVTCLENYNDENGGERKTWLEGKKEREKEWNWVEVESLWRTADVSVAAGRFLSSAHTWLSADGAANSGFTEKEWQGSWCC